MMNRPWISSSTFKTAQTGAISVDRMFDGWKYIVMLTDTFTGGTVKDGTLGISSAVWENLLELRAFDGKQELRIFRESAGDSFSVRLTDDSGISDEDYFDETMLLNINRNKVEPAENGTFFGSVSGGKYFIPAPPDSDCVKIRNYISYDELGTAVCTDFRIIGFGKGSE